MSSLLTLGQDLEQKSREQQQRTGEMLKAAFSEHEQSVRQELNESAKRINCAISDHNETIKSALASNTKEVLKAAGKTWAFIALVSFLLICTSGAILWWQGTQIRDHYTLISEMKQTEAMLSKKNNGVRLSVCGDSKRPCVKVNPEAGAFGEDSGWMVLAGK
ncbi:MbeB family mobilization protein [Salmonella enterica]|uniref:Mobilization protein n=1 Tax=Salmonella enterica TaxID=28901 RepID=A0A5V5HM72_SALER|nr:mobilization protein [Salmonella enterica]ECT9455125.1 mobilization protein [Salmonella enterica subsp. enterica serovar Oskarshamn]EDR5682591.1 mobilization protein [Salmonella enterica subsp. enterica serovar Nima]EHA4239918.1 mobilization protein [Salmonella enterica subsp. enterica serovar Litchfield]EBR2642874.1 mobilization protein [Salmonella enterica]